MSVIPIQRLLSKFIFSFLGIITAFAANILVANHIGPHVYGQYGFILAAGTFLVQITMVTLNETYVYYLSINKCVLKEVNLAYLILMLIVFSICIFIFLASVYFSSLRNYFWPHIDKVSYLIISLIYVLLLNGQQGIIKYSDCHDQYDQVERLRFFSKLVSLGLIMLFWVNNTLNLMNYFFSLLLSLFFFYSVFISKYSFPVGISQPESFKQIFKKLYLGWGIFSLYPLLDALFAYSARYVLQGSGGPVEQGYYTYALFLATIPISVLTIMINIYMSKMSKLYSQSLLLITKPFLTIMQLAILFYGTFSFYLITNANQIIRLLSGDSYQAAAPSLKWLAIFAFLNIFGLLGGNLYFCTERMRSYRTIVSIFNFFNISVLFILYQTSYISALHLSIAITLMYGLKVFVLLYGNFLFLKIKVADFIVAFIYPLAGLIGGGLFINILTSNLYGRTLLEMAFVLGVYSLFYLKYRKQINFNLIKDY